jgi:chemotaxis regulatin CheY-phosphate phosphatase CheZ
MAQEEKIDDTVETTESVIMALHKVITLLDRIKNAIEESSNKIPKVSVQLNKVTQATELATVEILDVLDVMGTKILTIETGLTEFDQAGISESRMLMLSGMKQTLSELKDHTSNISIALQIQDISTQKINAANHLIESVRYELLDELNYFESARKKTDNARRQAAGETAASKSFDINASYMKTPDHQSKIDDVISAWQEKNTI